MKKILVVDDKRNPRASVAALLKRFFPGCAVISAAPGSGCIGKAKAETPDIILLARETRGLDGFEVREKLKSDEKTKHIPVIMTSAIKTDARGRVEELEVVADALSPGRVEKAEPTARVNVRPEGKKTGADAQGEKEELERRLEKRTLELARKNERLKKEIEVRKRAERDLKEARRVISDGSGIAFTRKNAAGWPVESVSDNVLEILGYSTDDFVSNGVIFSNCVHPDDVERYVEEISRCAGDATVNEFEHEPYRMRTKNGGEKVIRDRVRVERDASGKAVYLRSLVEDVTRWARAEEEKKKLESRLRQTRKMEVIGTLAGGIAHDFNNILSAVIGYTEVLLDDIEDGSPNPDNVRQVLAAGLRARDLIQQILTFSRQDETKPGPVFVKPLVKEALKLLRATLPSTIEIEQDLKGDPLILAAPTQIHQILLNLCANAGHAMRENGGVLKVRLDRVEVGTDYVAADPDMKPGPFIRLVVSDTGHGMLPEVMEKILDPFFTTKEKGEGVGMGLSVVHGIVASIGGTVEISSDPGEGSTFTLLFPAMDVRVEHDAGLHEPFPGGAEHILLVDDEPPIVATGGKVLQALGYKVTTLTSSVDALELFKKKRDEFDLVITDLTMPDMTGDKLAEKILAVKPGIPVILCTGFSSRITPEEAGDMGVRAFLLKPLLKRELAETIRKVLDEKNA